MFLAIGLYSQNSTLLQNKNFRANDLKHKLNKKGDSLILESNKTIYNVEIFNEDFSKTVKVNSTKTVISLKDTPIGRLVVQAKLADKRIIMTLLRHNSFDEIVEVIAEEKIADATKPKEQSVSSLLNWKPKKSTSKKETYYWAVQESNNGSNSYKSMKLVTLKELSRMIIKNKIEVKTSQGKDNRLTVWEVYNTAKFMEKQVADPDYIFSTSSVLFNTTPYFNSIGDVKIP
jgi:hypothetical protein